MVAGIKRYIRQAEDVKADFVARAKITRHPILNFATAEELDRIFAKMNGLDRDAWADAFSIEAAPYQEQALAAERAGDTAAALEAYRRVYGFHRMARYPAPNSTRKRVAYDLSRAAFFKMAQNWDPPVERVVMPFKGRPGEGDASIGLLRLPKGVSPAPVVVMWGGIDTYKEEVANMPFPERGIAFLSIDMPGTGEAPIPGSEDAERMFTAVFDYIASRPELDAGRIGVIGSSTGGYWAAKLAHTHRDRIRAAIDWGGCTHIAFEPPWIERSQSGEYPLELAETLASAFGMSTFEDWVENAPRFSLLTQGVLDQPCAPLLLANGNDDTIFPIADMHLLLEHGSPKHARFFEGPHMASGNPAVFPMMAAWIEGQLRG